jgi:hypothetical protein
MKPTSRDSDYYWDLTGGIPLADRARFAKQVWDARKYRLESGTIVPVIAINDIKIYVKIRMYDPKKNKEVWHTGSLNIAEEMRRTIRKKYS